MRLPPRVKPPTNSRSSRLSSRNSRQSSSLLAGNKARSKAKKCADMNPFGCQATPPDCCLPRCTEDRNPHFCRPDPLPCSLDPQCHTLPALCQPISFDAFPNPFRLPGQRVPFWVSAEAGGSGKALRFFGFYQEGIPESRVENYRVHQLEIRYYLEDASIEVYEARTVDAGFPQGKIIRRGRIPLPFAPKNSAFYNLPDLNVGCEVNFYGKVIFITGVDPYTRTYLNRKLGIGVPPNIQPPPDPYTETRKDLFLTQFPRRPGCLLKGTDKLRKFLALNGKVLRFWALWDNRCDLAGKGELKAFFFLYYLEDDTVEVRELLQEVNLNSSFSSNLKSKPFLRRSKLYKSTQSLVPAPVGSKAAALAVLNTSQNSSRMVARCGTMESRVETMKRDDTYRPIMQPPAVLTDKICPPGQEEGEFVKDRDLAIGAVIPVYGRLFILTDCDEATKRYYRERYGIEKFEKLVLDEKIYEEFPPRMKTPPPNGFGDDDETARNWEKMVKKRLPNPRYALKEDDILTFHAQLHQTLHRSNGARRFLLKIFMIDNSFMILELPHQNTGFPPGIFLRRGRFPKRGGAVSHVGEESEYYSTPDYFVGNTLEINGFNFLLTFADEVTLAYMEANADLFPQSNICRVLEKVREAFAPLEGEAVLKTFASRDSNNNGSIPTDEFLLLLKDLSQESLSQHEMTTLTRAFRVDPPPPCVDWTTVQSVAQTELQRHKFDQHLLARTEYTLRSLDNCRSGHVEKDALRSVLKGSHLPLDWAFIDFIVDNFPWVDDCCRVNYCELLRFLDWVHNPCPCPANPSSITCVFKWIVPSPPKSNCVNYHAFISQVHGNYRTDLASICCPPSGQCGGGQGQRRDFSPERPRYLQNSATYQEMDPRTLASSVVTDLSPKAEARRCADLDQCPPSYPYPYDGNRINFQNQEEMDPCLAAAYSQCEECEPDGVPNFYSPGDRVGSWDIYKQNSV